MLVRSFLPEDSRAGLLAYTPMFHARLFAENSHYREKSFEPTRLAASQAPDQSPPSGVDASTSQIHLDGNPSIDRPLFVQFCANNPDTLLAAAKHVQPYCDAVDLNLGCPQGIARRGHYGAFLQEDKPLIYSMIRKLHEELDVPVTAKIRVLDTNKETLAYTQGLLDAGASIIAVHGRRREMKGHQTGLADWKIIRYLRDNLPPDTVIFANGNILQHTDIARCLSETGADAVISAEGSLCDPSIFSAVPPPPTDSSATPEYWRGRDGKGGYRLDAVFRRYLDLIHKYVFAREPPARQPLYIPDKTSLPPKSNKRPHDDAEDTSNQPDTEDTRPGKKQKLTRAEKKALKKRMHIERKPTIQEACNSPNLTAIRAHLFSMLRPLVAKHTNVRDALARCPAGDIDGFEEVLSMVEAAVREGLDEYERENAGIEEVEQQQTSTTGDHPAAFEDDPVSSKAAIERCRRPWWVCQPYIRPLPAEALVKGALQPKKKGVDNVTATSDQVVPPIPAQKSKAELASLQNGLSQMPDSERIKEAISDNLVAG
jgi:tRNA-dihydrouridine synthase 1